MKSEFLCDRFALTHINTTLSMLPGDWFLLILFCTCSSRIRKRSIMAEVKKTLAVILAVICMTAAAEPEYHTFESHYGEDIVVKEEIKIYKEDQYLLATITPVEGKITATVNLHDFAEGYTAIKDEDGERCYILETSHTLEEMIDTFKQSVERKGYFDMTKAFSCTKKQIISNSELDQFGDRIADFCNEQEVVFSKKHFLSRKRRSTIMISGSSMICGICVSLNCSSSRNYWL